MIGAIVMIADHAMTPKFVKIFLRTHLDHIVIGQQRFVSLKERGLAFSA